MVFVMVGVAFLTLLEHEVRVLIGLDLSVFFRLSEIQLSYLLWSSLFL
jgi:hypothetical protein